MAPDKPESTDPPGLSANFQDRLYRKIRQNLIAKNFLDLLFRGFVTSFNVLASLLGSTMKKDNKNK